VKWNYMGKQYKINTTQEEEMQKAFLESLKINGSPTISKVTNIESVCKIGKASKEPQSTTDRNVVLPETISTVDLDGSF